MVCQRQEADVKTPKLRLKLTFDSGLTLGPGKADLLQGIAADGSISAAGRRMRMSYKRAWMLVEEMNAAFEAPLVESSRGGASGGGARLTAAGEAVLAHYRKLEAITLTQGADEISGIARLLKDATE
ncbi:MAG: LysR family transcriptional regulator [Hoeflea sp.]|nr:LysR family transcriptional regulator [Alphaproteobacteria bacterium]MBV1725924.1 LysR family transcriptional regulator [Hoeflea sp.]MBU4545880.1 LysR family transcriptional regulator [Alphaproteobacteria bacterium]MBU4549927.1 LysR family transcriptional regulator [Alphaproteobacteria bacterium]MBV1762649.1 LysR family transcriptional regulator [Hoeflea sp.]